MAELAISVARAGKRYRKRRGGAQDLWALRGVDLEVAAGESLGVLGPNGAGKSTLLSLLAGVTAPTEGAVRVRGRIAPLLAVGVGFHRELTGRENVFVNGRMLGMDAPLLRKKLDDIVEFAGLAAFIDTPVKFYSSGMYVRLGFAVATAVEPDVLLVDEVLAVGDMDFQARSFDRMRSVRDAGAAVVVVSHNALALQVFCERGVVVDRGRLVYDGGIDDAVDVHMRQLGVTGEAGGPPSLRLVRSDGGPAGHVESGETVTVEARLRTGGLSQPAVELVVASERAVVHTRRLPLPTDSSGTGAASSGTGAVDVVLTVDLPVVTGTYSVTVGVGELSARDPLPASPGQQIRVTAPRVAHGAVDLQARLV
jgi:ABC-type polysaccharide/polyol phosphate transport system ATPase subunit